jgi:exo-beta-1,3-glucanase (GH17 family)
MNLATSLISARPRRWQVALVFAVFLAIAAGLTFQTWQSGRTIDLPNAEHDQLACASYTPSHNGHTVSVSEKKALVASDLKLLATRFRCVRTYSVSEGLDEVPKVARQLGLKVMLGLWISSHGPSNDKEIAHGIDIANQYSDVVTAIIVGNEVLLRHEQTASQLLELIKRVRAGTSIPVTYADVWEFWLRNPELAGATNFVTVHILPYWEDNPIGIDHALEHVQSIYAKVRDAFPNTTVFIGETGWPSAGRPRLTAMPSSQNQARFLREFVVYAEREQIPYNLIEAFDQPWKRLQEGTVGGYWGLYDATGEPKFPFTGNVVVNPKWRMTLLFGLIAGACFVVGSAFLSPRISPRAFALLGLTGYIAGIVLVAQWQYLETANRYWLEWIATLGWAVCGWIAYTVLCIGIARWLDGAQLSDPASFASVIRSWGYHGREAVHSRLLGVLRILLLASASYVCLALAYDGRGRDFPLALVALPVVMFGLLDLFTKNAEREHLLDNEELLLSLCLCSCALYIAWRETSVNLRAWSWSGICILFALPIFRRAMYPHKGTQQKTDAAQLEGIQNSASNAGENRQ